VTTPIEFDGKLEFDELLDGNRIALARAPRAQLHRWISILFGAALGVVVGYSSNSPTLLIFALVVVAFYFYQRWRIRETLQQRFQARTYQVSFHTRVDTDGFRTRSSMFDDRRQWSDFSRWTETDRYFVLFESAMVFRVIPKRIVGGAADATILRQLLTMHLGPAA